eukprot:3792176-Prymnesium_polylepis.1
MCGRRWPLALRPGACAARPRDRRGVRRLRSRISVTRGASGAHCALASAVAEPVRSGDEGSDGRRGAPRRR